MTLSDLGSIGSLLASIAVFITLVYLSRQVKQGNMQSRAQTRQRMAEHEQSELHLQTSDISIPKILGKSILSEDEQIKLHFFLLSAMRQREWEWFQFKDGVIGEDVYKAYHGVIPLHLGSEITRKWWHSVGRIGFDDTFAKEVDQLLLRHPVHDYYQQITNFAQTS